MPSIPEEEPFVSLENIYAIARLAREWWSYITVVVSDIYLSLVLPQLNRFLAQWSEMAAVARKSIISFADENQFKLSAYARSLLQSCPDKNQLCRLAKDSLIPTAPPAPPPQPQSQSQPLHQSLLIELPDNSSLQTPLGLCALVVCLVVCAMIVTVMVRDYMKPRKNANSSSSVEQDMSFLTDDFEIGKDVVFPLDDVVSRVLNEDQLLRNVKENVKQQHLSFFHDHIEPMQKQIKVLELAVPKVVQASPPFIPMQKFYAPFPRHSRSLQANVPSFKPSKFPINSTPAGSALLDGSNKLNITALKSKDKIDSVKTNTSEKNEEPQSHSARSSASQLSAPSSPVPESPFSFDEKGIIPIDRRSTSTSAITPSAPYGVTNSSMREGDFAEIIMNENVPKSVKQGKSVLTPSSFASFSQQSASVGSTNDHEMPTPSRSDLILYLVHGLSKDYRRLFVPGRGWVATRKVQEELNLDNAEVQVLLNKYIADGSPPVPQLSTNSAERQPETISLDDLVSGRYGSSQYMIPGKL